MHLNVVIVDNGDVVIAVTASISGRCVHELYPFTLPEHLLSTDGAPVHFPGNGG